MLAEFGEPREGVLVHVQLVPQLHECAACSVIPERAEVRPARGREDPVEYLAMGDVEIEAALSAGVDGATGKEAWVSGRDRPPNTTRLGRKRFQLRL